MQYALGGLTLHVQRGGGWVGVEREVERGVKRERERSRERSRERE